MPPCRFELSLCLIGETIEPLSWHNRLRHPRTTSSKAPAPFLPVTTAFPDRDRYLLDRRIQKEIIGPSKEDGYRIRGSSDKTWEPDPAKLVIRLFLELRGGEDREALAVALLVNVSGTALHFFCCATVPKYSCHGYGVLYVGQKVSFASGPAT